MKQWKIGLDVDGVLGDFTFAFTAEMRGLFPQYTRLPFHTWEQGSWDFGAMGRGLTPAMIGTTCEEIKASPWWWADEIPLMISRDERERLSYLSTQADVYAITSRIPTGGVSAVAQTTTWLDTVELEYITPIVASKKAPVVEALGLDFYIDDKVENCLDVAEVEGCRVFVMEQPYNLTLKTGVSLGCKNWRSSSKRSRG